MNAGKPDSPKKSPKRFRLFRWMAGLLLFYTVLGFFILPPIVRSVAVKQLSAQLDREVSIEKIKINPYALSTTIRGFLIKDKDGQPFVSWDEVYVNLQIQSFFGHTWVFDEISTTNPYVRVQMNKDYTLNFSDLIAKFSTNTAPAKPGAQPARPLALRIDHLRIAGASASLTDLTTSTPFKRVIGPLDISLEKFRTDPENKNPYSFTGTTDAGEKISWAGYFFLDPLRSHGELALENISLNKYAPLYQDFVRFQIKDGVVDLRSEYEFELSASNRVALATNSSFALHSFKLAETDSETNVAELAEFAVSGASVDAIARRAEVNSITSDGAKLFVQRNKEAAINVVELSKPVETATNAPGGIIFLLRSVTNVVAELLNSTNLWTGVIHEVHSTNGSVQLADYVNSRPVTLSIDGISVTATNISNVPGTNLTASLALRWNTNGTLRTDVSASFFPATVDVDIALDKIELHPLDPYLESRLNVFVTDSRLGMNGHVKLQTPKDALPEVTFHGDVWLDDFATVDGEFGEDLLKWKSVRISGIDANLNPQTVAVKEVAIDDAFVRVVIETNKTINLLAALRANGANSAAENPEEHPPKNAAAEKKPAEATASTNTNSAMSNLPKISVASVVISNAQVRFTDRSISPTANVSIQEAGGSINGLSTEQLEHADLNLHARVDGVGPVEITGTINPFSETSTNQIKVTAKNIDLTPESPYAGRFAGYRIAKGKLNLALEYELHGRNIKSSNLITLDQFTFGEKVNSPDATKLPVRLGVAILKDREGRIILDVPVEGSLDDPKFKLSKVIWRAVENILIKVATSPFSLLGAAFGGKGEELNYQDFAPGSSVLTAESTNKLESLVKALYERPALQLEISGSVDPGADRDGLRRIKLDKQLRVAKWSSLSKSRRSEITPDQIALTPDERADFMKMLYDTALSRGAISNTPPPVAATSAVPSPAAGGPVYTTTPQTKGAALLMRSEPPAPPRAAPAAAAVAVTGGPAVPATSTPGSVEQALLDNISVSDDELETLANERAKVVRDHLLAGGKVEGERLFLTEIQHGNVRTNGCKVYLQLQ